MNPVARFRRSAPQSGRFLYTDFVSHLASNQRFMAPSLANVLRLAAIARLNERQHAGRGDAPLYFDDLIDRIEVEIGALRAGTGGPEPEPDLKVIHEAP